MIIFDPHPPFIDCCIVDLAGRKKEHRILVGDGWERSIESFLESVLLVDGIGYVLHQGGETVVQPSSRVSEDTLGLLHETISALPEHNEYTYRVCEYLYRAYQAFLTCCSAKQPSFLTFPQKRKPMRFLKSFGISTSAGLEPRASSTNGPGEHCKKIAQTSASV